MAIIHITADVADLATFFGLANPGDTGVLDAVDSPFQGANNRNNDPGGLDPLTIEGETGDPVDVVVDCQNVGITRGFIFDNGESNNVILQYLTIMNGNYDGGYGDGVYCFNGSSPVIRHCIIMDCVAAIGGGICCDGASSNPIITNCLIFGNTAGKGGGIHVYRSAAPLIYSCTIAGNNADTYGGGFYSNSDAVSTTMTDSILWGNTAGTNGNQIAVITPATLLLNYSDYANGGGDVFVNGTFTPTNCITTDPLFVAGPQGNYYLSQIAAGEGADSGAVDTGSDTAANLGMDTKTTRSDKVFDEGQVDMGFHYLDAEAGGPSDAEKSAAMMGQYTM